MLKEQRHKKVVTIKFDNFYSYIFSSQNEAAIKNYFPNRLTTPLKKIIKSWIFIARSIKLIFYLLFSLWWHRCRIPFVTICHYTIDSWEYKTKEPASHRGGCWIPMLSLANPFDDEPHPWKHRSLRKDVGELRNALNRCETEF